MPGKRSQMVRVLSFAAGAVWVLGWLASPVAADDAEPAKPGSTPQTTTISKETPPSAPAASDAKTATDAQVPPQGLKAPSAEIAATAPPKPAADAAPKAKRRGVRDSIDTALATFESFCGEWQRMLRDREVNNLKKLVFLKQGEYQTATYKGYGTIDSCSCREVKGFAIGKLSYDEFDYYIVGKTPEEAKSSKPKVSGTTRTTEIFRWERGKWFY
jgi:hypothetical protein